MNTMLLLMLMMSASMQSKNTQLKLVEVRKIWDAAPHNAFTDLIRFRDEWFCCFREGKGHAGDPGRIRVLVSRDAKHWESIALFERENEDYRDPKLSVTPEGQLMLLAASAVPGTRNPLRDHYTFVCFSRDGRTWTPPRKVVSSWEWLWRVTWQGSDGYGVAYRWDREEKRQEYTAVVYHTKDGLDYRKLAEFAPPHCNEATLRFDGTTLYCLQRRDGQPNTALLGVAQPPYKEWAWKDLGSHLGGPNFIRLPNGRWLAAGRMFQNSQPRTVICELDVHQGRLHPLLTLPSGGDTSYPGLVWHDGKLYVSYYSSHEGKAAVYLAVVTFA
ncbi:MAG: glycoside hydrolase [Gemmatales bacterium]|nr:glycoside hydrolase [Gemmatales bacterium]